MRYIFEGQQSDSENLWPGIENEIGTRIHEIIQNCFLNQSMIIDLNFSYKPLVYHHQLITFHIFDFK
jgi:hypothetical protein